MIDSLNEKREFIKSLIHELHQGLSVEEARDRFVEQVGDITASEIAAIEQSLIDEGMDTDEIKRFCNVHALLFEEALEGAVVEGVENPAHPVYLFQQENRAIEERVAQFREFLATSESEEVASRSARLRELLEDLHRLDAHYVRKEQILFPYLEKYAFMGPSKVMWGKDDEVRELLKEALQALEGELDSDGLQQVLEQVIDPLLEEVEGMVFKEEKILFPTALEKLTNEDWVEVLKESDQVGYAFIEAPAETEALIRELATVGEERPRIESGTLRFPTGSFNLAELEAILKALPVEITFVDAEDRVKYFSDHAERIFVRTKSVIGREVHNCHPPGSVDLVEQIVESFKEGTRRTAEFWLEMAGRFIYIEFIALRDPQGNYLGVLELTQDLTEHRARTGERRLLDESH